MHLLPPQREVDRCSQFRARSFRIQTHRNRAMACAIALGNAGFATSNRSVGTHGLDLSVGTRPSSDRRPAAALAPEIHCGDAERPSERRGRSLQSPRPQAFPIRRSRPSRPRLPLGYPHAEILRDKAMAGAVKLTCRQCSHPPLLFSVHASKPSSSLLPSFFMARES